MAAITSVQQTELIQYVVGLYGAAAGGYMPELAGYVTNQGYSTAAVGTALAGSTSFKAQGFGLSDAATNSQFVDAFCTNLFGSTVAATPLAALKAQMNDYLDKGYLNRAQLSQVIISKLAAVSTTDADFGTAAKAFANKVAVAKYYTMDMSGSSTDLATLRAPIAATTSTSDVSSSTAIQAIVDNTSAGTTGQTYTLTTGIDTFLGGASNDQFNATQTSTSAVLGGLDSIDGAGGSNNTFNVADTATAAGAAFTLPAGFSAKNIQTINVTTNGSLGDDASAATAFNVSGVTGLTSFKGTSAGDGTTDTSVIAADTTDVALTVAAAQITTVAGGKVVSVTGGAAGSTITGDALTSVTVKNSAGMTIDNTTTSRTVTSVGTTLTAVTLDAVDSDTAIKGKGVTNLTLQNATATTNTVTVTNTTTGHSLTLNVNGSGYDSLGAAQAQTVADAAAKSVTVNATGSKSNIVISTGAANTVLTSATITGSVALALNLDSSNNTALATIDGSAATGNLTLTNTAAATSIKTGAGNDTFTSTVVGTTKSTVDSGAGNDKVTLSGGLVAGSTVSLGAGNDTLLGTTVIAASTSTAVTVVDGGDGIDSVSSGLINAGNAAQFKNFENVSLQGSSLDLALLTGSTISGLSIDAAATTTVSNATQAMGLTVTASGTSSTINFTGATGTSDAYSIAFNATTTGTTASPTTINAGTVVINKIENVTINSSAAAGVAANQITLTDDTLQTLTINGSQALTVAFTGTNGTVSSGVGGVSSIDGSAATGKLSIDLANITNASAGITVKGGSAVDTLTTSTSSSTLTGNGGNDSFVVAATTSNVTAAVDATQTAILGGTFKYTTITDFTKNADTLTLISSAASNTFTSAKVDVSLATNLGSALDLAAAGNGAPAASLTKWFQWGSDSYLVQDRSAATTVDTTDVVVKLTGVTDLSTSSVTAAGVFTFA